MKQFKNIENILDSVGQLRKHLENAEVLISYLEKDLDEDGAYRYVETDMSDIKTTYDELLKLVETLSDNLDSVVND